MTYGVQPTGFVEKTVQDVLSEMEDAVKAAFGAQTKVGADSVIGNYNGIVGDKVAEIWEVMGAVYRAMYPDSSDGEALDNVCALTGTIREGAQSSAMQLTCTGDPATSLLTGRIVRTGGGDLFQSVDDGALAAATAWGTGTGYNLGDFVTNDSKIYACVQAGTSAGSGGPTGTGDDIVDNTCKWDYVGDGTACATIQFDAQETGPVEADAGSVHVGASVGAIVTPISGWDGARNLEDAVVGRDVEADPDLRIRREEELRAIGGSSVEAILSDVLLVDGVTEAFVFENTGDVTDGDGLPPRSVEVVVLGGDGPAVAQAIFDTVGAGVQTYGSSSETVTDSQGITHTTKFTRPTERDVYLIIDLAVGAAYPTDGDDQVRGVLVTRGDSLGVGDDVVAEWLKLAAFEIAGVYDITAFKLGFAPAPTGTANLTIGSREIADFDTSRVVVNS